MSSADYLEQVKQARRQGNRARRVLRDECRAVPELGALVNAAVSGYADEKKTPREYWRTLGAILRGVVETKELRAETFRTSPAFREAVREESRRMFDEWCAATTEQDKRRALDAFGERKAKQANKANESRRLRGRLEQIRREGPPEE